MKASGVVKSQKVKEKNSGKLWNRNIEIENNTSPHALLHEQLHAHSISYYNMEIYRKY